MKKYVVFSLVLIMSALIAKSSFESESYVSESSSEQAFVNGKPVKVKSKHKSKYQELGGEDNKITHQQEVEDQDVSNENPETGVAVGGDDYFNYVTADFNSTADYKAFRKSSVIRLIDGYCSMSPAGEGFTNNARFAVKKNNGDFFFGLFNTDVIQLSDVIANTMLASVFANIQTESIDDKFDLGLGLIGVLTQEEIGYDGNLDITMGLLYGTRTKAKLSICSVGNARCAIGMGKSIKLYDAITNKEDGTIQTFDITQGNVLFFGTDSFWDYVKPDEAMRKASINFAKRRGRASAAKVAEDLVALARSRGAQEAISLLVVYIL